MTEPAVAVLGSKSTCLRLVRALTEADVPIAAIATLDDTGDTRSEMAALTDLGAHVAATAAEAYAAIDAARPVAVLVAGWYRIIPDEVLDRYTVVGAHYSALPTYRGSAPVVWAMINGEHQIGYSVFRLTSGMDEGPIAASGSVPGDGYVSEVLDRLDKSALPELVNVARRILDGTVEFRPQPDAVASYAGPRRPADGEIDWTRPALELERFIRAQSHPYPGATARRDGLVHVWRATAMPERYFGAPGQTVRLIDARPVVACGDGTGLLLEETEPAVRWTIGSRFDSSPDGPNRQ